MKHHKEEDKSENKNQQPEEKQQPQTVELTAYEKEKIIKTFLPVMDNFEQTIRNTSATNDLQSLQKALTMLYEQMVETLRLHNVEQIKSLGEVFLIVCSKL